MATKKSHTQIETLPGINAPISTEELAKQRSFSTIIRPEMWGINVMDYADIDKRMIELADPAKFAEHLFGPKVKKDQGKHWAEYECDDGSWQPVALNSIEYLMIPRSPNLDYLATRIDASVDAGRYSLASPEIRNAKSAEVQFNAFSFKYVRIHKRIQVLDTEIKKLTSLQEAATNNWMRRGRTDNFRVKIVDAQFIAMRNMFLVLENQRDWTKEKKKLAKRASEYRLFFTQPPKDRYSEWVNMLNVLITYDRCKIALFKDRAGRIEGKFGKEAIRATLDKN